MLLALALAARAFRTDAAFATRVAADALPLTTSRDPATDG